MPNYIIYNNLQFIYNNENNYDKPWGI